MIVKEKYLLKILLCLGIFVIVLLLVNYKRQQPRTVSEVSIWPKFVAKDVTGKEIRGDEYRNRIRYVQFVGIEDDNNIAIFKQVYSQWSENVDVLIFTKQYQRLRNRLAGEFPHAIFIEERYEEISKLFRSTKYGKHYIYDKSGANVYSSENNIRYEDGVDRILNLFVKSKQFRIADFIREKEDIKNHSDFGQVKMALNEVGNKYLLVGMIFSFCESCSSGAFINTLKKLHSKGGGNGKILLVLSNEYGESDIEVFKSQLQVEFPVIIADPVLSRKWRELISEYSKSELNNMAFSINPSGKIDEVLDPLCGNCVKPFWEEIFRRF